MRKKSTSPHMSTFASELRTTYDRALARGEENPWIAVAESVHLAWGMATRGTGPVWTEWTVAQEMTEPDYVHWESNPITLSYTKGGKPRRARAEITYLSPEYCDELNAKYNYPGKIPHEPGYEVEVRMPNSEPLKRLEATFEGAKRAAEYLAVEAGLSADMAID
ncbi:hypothetical protein OG874_43965 [Nocardia sp. NBC_00565]|uniref:hypothetical protein n=1 Tax=Nocardia sp. NBC_00565 TaxID=2975993 RepID=UPI002E803130|nr:hypothetical protein [Nocardia sp. NBC_00565]WUC03524.1 hypothetical protein OG874_43965 [Nocardia sp. NBC_00565]